jgi:membrane protein YqaA with SNARE-associated domain
VRSLLDSIVAALGIYGGTLVAGVLSGLIPIINGELFLIGVVLLSGKVWPAIVLAVLVAVGQMIAKIILYKMAHGATGLGKESRFGKKLEAAKAKVEKWKTGMWQDKPLAITFVSALTGLPPFYIVTLLAGALGVRFKTFLLLGIIGRVVRFVALALLVLWF